MNERATIPGNDTTTEVVYDAVSEVRTDGAVQEVAAKTDQPATDSGCHGGKAELARAAVAAGNGELMQRLRTDYPQGPHDQPQSMCPAFGSLRVGLRMRRTATILSGSACCVYGLTFTSHFYGAKRTVGYVPFNSETLVTGKLYEDIREAVHKLADPELYDTIIVTNLCVPTASGVPLRALPKEINGVRVVGIDVRDCACRRCRGQGRGPRPTEPGSKALHLDAAVDVSGARRQLAGVAGRMTWFASFPIGSSPRPVNGARGRSSSTIYEMAAAPPPSRRIPLALAKVRQSQHRCTGMN